MFNALYLSARYRIALLGSVLLFLLTFPAIAQQADDPIILARPLMEQKQWDKAIEILSKAYDAAPGNGDIYHDYLLALIGQQDYKSAEALVSRQQHYVSTPLLAIDHGHAYELLGKEKKATEQYEIALKAINGDEVVTQQVASAFQAVGRDNYAIQAYERTRTILQNPYLYNSPLSRLYAKTGDISKSIDALLTGSPSPYGLNEDPKATLLELLGNDPTKLQLAQKALIRRINLQPENNYYSDLLTWLYTQKGDWDGALLQIQAMDERSNTGGQGQLQFAQLAEKEDQYDIAVKSLDGVIAMGKEKPYYAMARAQRLTISLHRLQDNPVYIKEDVNALEKEYEAFLAEFSQYSASEIANDYASLEAQYNNNPRKGIEILRKAIAQPTASAEYIGRSKLQLGDYLILDGNVWEASLTYSQVDKAFREDVLGEEARFRNGKLSYYRGDFGMAQGQLSVLKASTSELIANDALYLSVLITENTPDSNNAALLQFAHADLLLFQNKDAQAVALLDSISTTYPKHPLQDDVLMKRAILSQKHRDYPQALAYLKTIYEKYGKDVLADDAIFKTAEIYDLYLKKPEEAKKFYEQLIIDYPGSTYVQTARVRLAKLSSPQVTGSIMHP